MIIFKNKNIKSIQYQINFYKLLLVIVSIHDGTKSIGIKLNIIKYYDNL